MPSESIAVIGTGFAGFGAGHRLENKNRPYVVYDRNSFVGGHTYSHHLPGGFVFDMGPHVSDTNDERIQQILAEEVGGRYEAAPFIMDNHWRGRILTHPLQVNLHGLPTELIVKILVDLVTAAEKFGDDERPGDYETWLRRSYGDTFAEMFPMTYGHKYHTTPMANLNTDWLANRMYQPSLEQALRGALEAAPVRHLHYSTHFRYPTEGGYASYLASWANRTDIRLEHDVVGISTRSRTLRFADGRSADYGQLISSIPLPALLPLIDEVSDDVLAAAKRLAFSSVVLVNLGIERQGIGGETHIRYVYDADIPFSRISFPHNMSPRVVPNGASSLQVEWYFSEKYKPLTEPLESFIEPTVAGLRDMGLIEPDDRILLSEAMFARYANVIYDHERAEALATIQAFLNRVGIHSCGRYGEWTHYLTDESFISGERAAEAALSD